MQYKASVNRITKKYATTRLRKFFNPEVHLEEEEFPVDFSSQTIVISMKTKKEIQRKYGLSDQE